MTEDLLLGQKQISKLTFPAKESPWGTGWHLAPAPVTTPQQVLFSLALSKALCFWPLSISSIHCPRSFLLSSVPFPASSHPSSQSLSLFLYFYICASAPTGMREDLYPLKDCKSAARPTPFTGLRERKRACSTGVGGFCMEPKKWGAGVEFGWNAEETVHLCSQIRDRREQEGSKKQLGHWTERQGPRLKSQLSLWLPWDSHYKDPIAIPVRPSGSACFSALQVQESSFFPIHCVDVILAGIKLFLPLTEVGMSLTMEKVRDQILVCGKSGVQLICRAALVYQLL